MDYDFEDEKVVEAIREKNARRVLLQLPEGLKNYGRMIARHIEEKTGVTACVSADPCYGGCDVATKDAEMLGMDLVVHYGHTPFWAEKPLNVIYVEARAKIDVNGALEKALPLLKPYRRIGLVSVVQHLHEVENVRQRLTQLGKEVYVGKASGRVTYDGQILGCDYTTAKSIQERVDAFLYVGGGTFHPIGLVMETGKPVIAADPYMNEASDLTSIGLKTLKRRQAEVAKVAEAKRIGLVVGLKAGQLNFQLAEVLKEKLEERGKEVTLLCSREITPETLYNFMDIEAFVNTACPRIGVDGICRYRKPIISASEALGMLLT